MKRSLQAVKLVETRIKLKILWIMVKNRVMNGLKMTKNYKLAFNHQKMKFN